MGEGGLTQESGEVITVAESLTGRAVAIGRESEETAERERESPDLALMKTDTQGAEMSGGERTVVRGSCHSVWEPYTKEKS